MLTLSYGYLKPQTGDKGSTFFPALEDDIQQLNDHIHDGITSAKLTAQSIIGVSDTIDHTDWVATSGGTYRQVVTMPPNTSFADYGMAFTISNGASSGSRIYPSIEKITNTTYYIYTNDNAIDLDVLYLV